MRPWTLRFSDFLSIKRTSAEIPVSPLDIAINAFLGNPQLLYVHQGFFAIAMERSTNWQTKSIVPIQLYNGTA